MLYSGVWYAPRAYQVGTPKLCSQRIPTQGCVTYVLGPKSYVVGGNPRTEVLGA